MPGAARETVAAIVGELRKLHRDIPVPADELARSKELRKGRMLMGLEDSYAMASWLGSNEILYGYVPTPEEIAERIDAVTVADVRARGQSLHAPAVQPGAGRPVRGRGGVVGVLAGVSGVGRTPGRLAANRAARAAMRLADSTASRALLTMRLPRVVRR